MSSPARSLLVFGIYLLFLGVGLLLAPNRVLAPFGVPPTSEVWIRVVGMLVLFLGIYYSAAARGDWRAFIALTVPARMSVIAFFGAFVFWLGAPPTLLLFAVVDFVFALWTWRALRTSEVA